MHLIADYIIESRWNVLGGVLHSLKRIFCQNFLLLLAIIVKLLKEIVTAEELARTLHPIHSQWL